MLGNKIYFIDAANNKVDEGVVLGLSVNEQGHKVYSVKTNDGKFIVNFCSLCFENKEDAEKILPEKFKINEEIKQLQKETNKKIDDKLDELRGKPEFLELVLEKSGD